MRLIHSKKAAGYLIHSLVSIFAAIIYYFTLKFFEIRDFTMIELSFIILISIFYGVLPDIDIKSSKIFKVIMISGLTILLLSIIFMGKWISIGLTLLLIIMNLAKHRKFIHSVLFGIVVSIPLLLAGLEYFAIAMIAFYLHLLIDSL